MGHQERSGPAHLRASIGPIGNTKLAYFKISNPTYGCKGWWSSGHRHRQLPRGSDLPAARQKVRVSPQPVSTEACPSLAHLSELDQPECGQDQTWTSTSGNQSRHDLSSFQGSIVCFPFSSIRCLCTQRSYTAQKKAGERRRWGCLNEWYGRSHGIIFR